MGTATDYSYSELESLWTQAGGNPASAPIAAAIAMAESGGNPSVVNSIGATGLWQILQSEHPQYSTTELQNPLTNAQAAVSISNDGSNWNPWETYTEGTYRNFLQAGSANPAATMSANTTTLQGQTTVNCSFGPVQTPSVGGVGGSSICLDGAVAVVAIGAGLVLLIGGLFIVVAFSISHTKVGQQAKKALTTAAIVIPK